MIPAGGLGAVVFVFSRCATARRKLAGDQPLLAPASSAPPADLLFVGARSRGNSFKVLIFRARTAAVATKCYMLQTSMPRKISQRELRNDSGAVLREVQAGHVLIVTRNGVPVAELRPVPARRFVPRAVIADAARRAPRVDSARLRADLDAVVDPSI